MYKPQHASTNFKALLRFTQEAQKRDGEIATFEFSGSYATFRYLPDEPMDLDVLEMYEVEFETYTIIFGMWYEEQIVIPVHVEDWRDGFNMDVFLSETKIHKPMPMIKGDQILYEIGKRIEIFYLED